MYPDDQQIDITKLKYVLYARKSTEDDSRQVRSIGDQIAECLDKAERLGLRVSKPYLKETKSAMKPGQRPIFTQMLKDIKKGKYDAILTWHPDRLTRNPKDSGDILYMLDRNQIKDLKFSTVEFKNDATGKMMLGMMFVFSKLYSDELSVKVSRGVQRGLAEGKSSGAPKHGYVRSEDGLYRPGDNFETIRDAWLMRLEGTSFTKIVDYLNDKSYIKQTKESNRKIKMTAQMLTVMFRDSFYYGILIQKEQEVNLRSLYDFQPMISDDQYFEVQQLSRSRKRGYQTKKQAAFYPLKGLVTCNVCKKRCYAAPSKGRYKRYLYYRCDNKECPQKSIRGKYVFDFIYSFLEEGLNFSEKEYKAYNDSLKKLTDQKVIDIKSQLHSKEGTLKHIQSNIKSRSLKIVDLRKGSIIWKHNIQEISEQEQISEKLKDEIQDLKKSLEPIEGDVVSIESFLNLSKNASVKVKAGDAVQKDAICRLIFLNLFVENEKVANYSLREPFATLLKNRKIISGRHTRTTIEPVLDTLYTLLLNYGLLRTRISNLQDVIRDLVKSDRVKNTDFLL